MGIGDGGTPAGIGRCGQGRTVATGHADEYCRTSTQYQGKSQQRSGQHIDFNEFSHKLKVPLSSGSTSGQKNN